ncbi:Rho-binding antiterminator [Chitinibacter sp. FCG-7]|uniref:Rho-binding antiterminator n=1 Tax=Chitinibacter mangrovi TaxID=3153927 RepID=A0AAU7F5P5_9NEIS
MNSNYVPIACDIYDYLEIAAMHREPLRIVLHNGAVFEAQACNVLVREHIEYFEVNCAGVQRQIRLDEIKTIESIASPPHFARISISPQPE